MNVKIFKKSAELLILGLLLFGFSFILFGFSENEVLTLIAGIVMIIGCFCIVEAGFFMMKAQKN